MMENLQIDTSNVPIDKREHPDFQRRMREIKRDLADLPTIEICCTHEAGHLIYFRRAGATQFRFDGPMIFYEAARDEFHHGLAGVKPLSPIYDVDGFAKGAVAGGVFSSLLCGQAHRGDSDDRLFFSRYIDHWLRQNPHLQGCNINADEMWRNAQLAVEEDLRAPDSPLRAEIPLAVAEIKLECFILT